MGLYKYRPLSSNFEIRVINLCTEQDDLRFGQGPVHCKIEHVVLESCQLTEEARSGKPVKGFDGSWLSPTVRDVKINTDEAALNDLWPRTLSEIVCAKFAVRDTKPPARSGTESLEIRDGDLPWRYVWGDYVALSYAWGDPTATHEIYVDGIRMRVTANLEAALRELRSHSRIQQGFRLWIDALCINQEDLKERAHQVTRMKDIYASAWNIAIWLGPEADDSDLAMTAMQYLSLRSKDLDPLRNVYHRVDKAIVDFKPIFYWRYSTVKRLMRRAVFRALYHLLERPYWRRLWILQEVALGCQNMPVICGTKCIPLDDIYQALEVIRIDGAELGNFIIRDVRGRNAMIKSWYRTRGDNYGISEKLWERPTEIIEGQIPVQRSKSVLYGGIFGALLLGREAFASDQRDRVYGILGLPSLSDIIKITPDYTLTPSQTFITFSRALYAGGDLNGLRLVASPVPAIGTRYLKLAMFSRPRSPKFVHNPRVISVGCVHVLPSWVVCWSCAQNPAFPLPRPGNLYPSTKPASKPVFDSNGVLMTVRGVLFDTVSSLSAFHATESESSYPFNGRSRDSIYGGHSATNEAIWRTLVVNMTQSGEEAPDTYNSILSPKLWDLGIGGVTRKLFGLSDFYWRNKRLRLFDRTLDVVISGRRSLKQKFLGVSENDTLRFPGNDQSGREAVMWAMRLLAWRRLVTTDGGYIGLVPAATKAGDHIVVVQGCDVPLVLRQDDECFRALGECYVHGIMSGEVLKMVEHRSVAMVDITLC